MSIFNKIFSTGVKETVSTIFDGIDKISTTKEEKAALRSQALSQIISDRKDAREMYEKDNILQKIFAIVFLVGYIIITFFMCWGAYKMTIEDVVFNNETVAILTMIFTAMSNKINTIVDFLFGGSDSKDIARK